MDLLLVLSSSSAVCSHSQAASTNHCVTAQRKAATTTGVDVGVSQEVSANICSAVHLVSSCLQKQNKHARVDEAPQLQVVGSSASGLG